MTCETAADAVTSAGLVLQLRPAFRCDLMAMACTLPATPPPCEHILSTGTSLVTPFPHPRARCRSISELPGFDRLPEGAGAGPQLPLPAGPRHRPGRRCEAEGRGVRRRATAHHCDATELPVRGASRERWGTGSCRCRAKNATFTLLSSSSSSSSVRNLSVPCVSSTDDEQSMAAALPSTRKPWITKV